MMTRSCSFSLRLPLGLLEKLENSVKEGRYSSVAEAIRTNVEVGFLVESYKAMIKVPEFIKSIDDLKQREGIFQWFDPLTDGQVDAIFTAAKMEKEKRYENQTMYRKFV